MSTEMDEEAESLAKEAIVLSLFRLYRSWDGKAKRALTDQYLEPVKRFSTSAVRRAYESIRDGGVEEAKDWLPQIPRWVAEVRRFDRPERPVIELHNGMIDMYFGDQRVDMRGLTTDEQDVIIRSNGKLGGRNAAFMSLEEKLAALNQEALPSPGAQIPIPKLRRV